MIEKLHLYLRVSRGDIFFTIHKERSMRQERMLLAFMVYFRRERGLFKRHLDGLERAGNSLT